MKKQSVIVLKYLFFLVLFQNTDFMETNAKVKV